MSPGPMLTGATPPCPHAHDVGTREEPVVTAIPTPCRDVSNGGEIAPDSPALSRAWALLGEGRDASLDHSPGGRPVNPRATP
jgi:hypothetical protein